MMSALEGGPQKADKRQLIYTCDKGGIEYIRSRNLADVIRAIPPTRPKNCKKSSSMKVGFVQRGTKRHVGFAKQDPGRARQNS